MVFEYANYSKIRGHCVCEASISGGPVDHRQPAKTCMSHIMRPIRE